MVAFFERQVDATALPLRSQPPSDLAGFYWHFVHQHPRLYVAIFVTGLGTALVDTMIPYFIGKLVGLMAATDRQAALADAGPLLLAMAIGIFLVRPVIVMLDNLVRNQAIVPGVTTAIRWQSHFHVVRNSLSFFQGDFAGRISNRVMSTANALRESVLASIRAVWCIAMYGSGALLLMGSADWRLAAPTLAWFIGYVFFLRHFVPRLRDRGRASAEAHSALMGRIVDSYSNILTVKLFSKARAEDAYVEEGVREPRDAIANHMRVISMFTFALVLMNTFLIGASGVVGVMLWAQGAIGVGVVAMALPLAWQIANLAGWVSWEITGIFENIGTVQEGMQSIATPHTGADHPDAHPLAITECLMCFERVGLAYDAGRTVLDGLDLAIRPGERIGLIGRSGAGKSTLVNLLLRFYEPQTGRILVDGPDIAAVTQQSLRAAIGMVTQDTSLLHRSIADNIAYGCQRGRGRDPGATRRADARQDRDRHRAPTVHDRADGSSGRDRPGQDRRAGQSRRVNRARRALRGVVVPAVGRLPRRGGPGNHA